MKRYLRRYIRRYIRSNISTEPYVLGAFYDDMLLGFLTKSDDVQQNINNTTKASGPRIFTSYMSAAKYAANLQLQLSILRVKRNGKILADFYSSDVTTVTQPGIFRGTEVSYPAHGKFIDMRNIHYEPIELSEATKYDIADPSIIPYEFRE